MLRTPSLPSRSGFPICILMSMIWSLVIISVISEPGRVLLPIVPLLIRYCIFWGGNPKTIICCPLHMSVNSTGHGEFKVAHLLCQWWSEDTKLQAERYSLKVQEFADLVNKFEEVIVFVRSEHSM